MTRERTQTSGSSHPVGAIIAGIVCAVGLSCCFITKDDLKSWRQNESGGRYWYDTGRYSGGGGGGGGATVGDGAGVHAVTIQEAACSIVWGLAGAYTGSGADYKWDVTLTLDSSLTDCSFGADFAGKIEAIGGNVYFGETAAYNYVGAAGYNGSTLSWFTNGYVTGGGGGTYAYHGNITW